jgi:ATP-dependent Lon protease
MLKNITKINETIFTKVLADINKILNQLNNKQLTNVLHYINSVKKNKNEDKITITNKTKSIRIDEINKYLTTIQNDELVIMEIYDLIKTDYPISLTKTITDMKNMRTNIMKIEQNMNDVTDVLNKSIHGHNYAKNQILKIIGQWMNGEQRGYSFGFEGSPGVGKTSLAKYGLANCLKDENGVSRPFAFIALGGSSNGSMLEGHGYTYVNSTW